MSKKFMKDFITNIFNNLGYDICISKKSNSSVALLDKNVWEHYYSSNDKIQLYYEGLKKADIEWSDNICKQFRFYSLLELVQYVIKKGIKGDFAECGVWKGHSAYMTSKLLAESKFDGGLHIFDSFEGGLSDKVEEDKNCDRDLSEEETLEEKNLFSSTEEQVKTCLKEFNFVNLYKGWIPKRFSEVENKQFAFVHIDVDLYEPTKDSLEFFYPRLVKNGVIVCDDYGLTQFPGAKKAFEEFLDKNDCQLFYEVPMGGCFIMK